jgi:hypothetical protein
MQQPIELRFRLNGQITEIFIQHAMFNGEPVGDLEIVVEVDGLGRFTIDDNSSLWDPALPKFVLEYRDETSWALIPPVERHTMKDKGWNQVTPQELLGILQSTGLVKGEPTF